MTNVAKKLLVVALATTAITGANAALTYGEPAISQPYIGLKGGQIIGDKADKNQKMLAYGVYGGYNFDKHFGVEVEYQTTQNKSYNVSGIHEIPRWADFGRGRPEANGEVVGVLLDGNKAVEFADLKEATQKVKSHASTYGAYGTYRHNLGDSNFYVKGKLGATRVSYYTLDSENTVLNKTSTKQVTKTDDQGNATVENQTVVETIPTTLVYNKKTHHTGLAGGASIGFQPAPAIGIELGYSYITHEATGYNLGVHLAF